MQSSPLLILAIFGFPLKYPFPRDERSLTVRGPVRGGCQRARSFDSRITVSRPSAVGRDVIVTLYTKSNFSFRLLVCGSSIDTQLCYLHEAFLFRANLLACLSLAKHKSDRAARRWASRHKNIRRHFAVTQLSKNRLNKRNQAALSERLGADLRRKGCEVYLNGT